MQIRYLLIALICSTNVLMTGCRTSPVYNVDAHSYVTNNTDYTEEDVKKAIIRAGTGLGWIIVDEEPGHVVGTLYLRSHMAKVDIFYDRQKYSIQYKDSLNLHYEPGKPEGTDAPAETGSKAMTSKWNTTAEYKRSNKTAIIHSNYNGWVQNLDNAIRTQLGSL